MSAIEEKVRFRRAVEDRLSALTPENVRSESLVLSEALARWAPGRGFEAVLATLPFPQEPDLTGFLEGWLTQGLLYLARTWPGRAMDFGQVTDFSGPWETKPYGMREPPASAPAWTPGRPTLLLVPGLAFAAAPGGGAWRLGRGAGYYDRWLARFGMDVFSLGVGLSVQTEDWVPLEPHDQRIDGWLVPGGFHGFLNP